MGLDNGFCIYKKGFKNSGDEHIEIAYFRKFYELDSFIRDTCTTIGSDFEDAFIVSVCDLLKLQAELEPIMKVLNKIPMRLIDKYDENGYPQKYKFDSVELSDERFNPTESSSSFAGYKTVKLYHAV